MTESSEKPKRTRRKKNELVETTIDYRNKMAEEKLRRIQLQNDHQAFD